MIKAEGTKHKKKNIIFESNNQIQKMILNSQSLKQRLPTYYTALQNDYFQQVKCQNFSLNFNYPQTFGFILSTLILMFKKIDPPKQKIKIINSILKLLMVVCLMQAFFLMFSKKVDSLLYLISSLIYFLAWRSLSYFGCIVNQIFNLTMIWNLLLQMANQLENGLYEIYLSAEVLYKISSLIFNIVCIYFNFSAYQAYKQLAYQIYEYQKSQNHDPQMEIKRQIKA